MGYIEDTIVKLPLGVSALIEKQIKNKHITLVVIKDDFKDFIYELNENQFEFKAAIVKSNNIISGHIILGIEDNLDKKYYPFHFNYYNKDSLALSVNLGRQKKICVILINKNNQYKEIIFQNNLKLFFRKYLRNCITHNYKWNEEEYKGSIVKMVASFPTMKSLWNSMGESVSMFITGKENGE
ncbi:hypothetical protein [Clostridium sp.]|uniref:hypothetical protein n=1 Tax=Clostridium sp. TaxID=1506 RepID=UPI0032175C30